MRAENKSHRSNVMNELELEEMAQLVQQVETVSTEIPEDIRAEYIDASDSVLRARAIGAISTFGSW